MIKLHAIIQWGLFQKNNAPKGTKRRILSNEASMRAIVHHFLMMLNLEAINSEDIKKYIQPYDIFEEDEFDELLKNRDNGETIQRLAGERANKTFRFGYCNYPNEIQLESFKNIQKTGNRQGVVILSENPIIENAIIKFRILREGRPGMSCIGFGVCDKSCLNICPFTCSRNFGSFICYYSFKMTGFLNMGDLGDKFIPEDYDKGFGQNDCVNIVVDTQNQSICFGVNDIMCTEKNFVGKKIPNMHLAVWLGDAGDEVQLIYEY